MNAPFLASCVLVSVTLFVGLTLLVSSVITGTPSLSSGASAAGDVISLLREADVPEDALIYELGSGWGALAVALARAFPHARVRGIEISPFPYLVSRLRALRYPNIQIEWGNFGRCDLSGADAITCYLMPGKMPHVARLLDASVRAGTLVVALEFWFRGRQVAAARRKPIWGAVAIYVWPASLHQGLA